VAGCSAAGMEQVLVAQAIGSRSQSISVPVNQVLTPAGTQVQLPGMRPQVLALSPDGKLLVTSGKHELVVIDPREGKALQSVPFPPDVRHATETNVISEEIMTPDTAAQTSYSGLIFSPDGARLYVSTAGADITVISV